MKAGHALLMTTDIFQIVFEKSPGSVLVKADKPLFTIMAVSDSYLQITSSKREDIVGRGFFQVFPDDLDFNEETKARSVFTRVVDSGQKIDVPTYRYDVVNPDTGQSEIRYWSCCNTPIIDNDGSVAYILNTVVDITGEVKAKNEAIENGSRLRMAAEAAAFGTWELNLKNHDFVYSPRVAEIFGHPADATLSLVDIRSQVNNDDMQNIVLKAFYESLETGKYLYEVRIYWPDGSLHWIKTQGVVIYDDDRQPEAILGAMLDITESKRDEIRKNDFIAMASHELKTPLTSIKAYLQLLSKKTEPLKDAFISNTLARANSQVNRMTALIHGFLDISRLEPGKLKLQTQLFDICRLAEETVSEFKLVNSQRVIDINCTTPLIINADREKIGQVINNFISNAIKYSGRDTPIKVAARSGEGHIRVTVTDTGIGVKRKDQEKIFQRFYRAENQKTKNISGFGIGLYLSSEIIQRHKGTIGVESEEGRGSTFYFTLPVTD